MKSMNLLMLLLTFGCNTNTQNTLGVKLSNVQRLKLDSFDIEHSVLYSAKIELSNNSDTVVDFWTMSCSWESNWIINKDCLKYYVDCNKNIPVLKKLQPHQVFMYNGIFMSSSPVERLKGEKIRTGFVFVQKDEIKTDSEFIRKLREKIEKNIDVIWSNSIVMEDQVIDPR
jgi:hypothetical protein